MGTRRWRPTRPRTQSCRRSSGPARAVFLFYLAGLSQAEVAEHLGTGEGAVRTRLHKARVALREHLDGGRDRSVCWTSRPLLGERFGGHSAHEASGRSQPPGVEVTQPVAAPA
jgi:hypothetical protein